VTTPEDFPAAWASSWGEDRFGLFQEFQVGAVPQRLRWIPPGRFLMGSPDDEPGRFDGEGPRHPVTISRGFWLADTPCTQALWEAVLPGTNPSRFRTPDRPVESVSFDDLAPFFEALAMRVGGQGWRLPNEAEWEYACRAGTTTALWTGPITIKGHNHAPELDAIAWYGGNSGVHPSFPNAVPSRWREQQYPHQFAATHAVGGKAANPAGLYDMLGNVYEWCGDAERPYEARSERDPIGVGGPLRVLRGGSWYSYARFVRASYRNALHPAGRLVDLGFRLARGPAPSPASGRAEPDPGPRSGPGAERPSRGSRRP
jgi:formylglycine-generating enzyme required for sulfatase activity